MKAMNKIKYAALALVALVVGACTAEEFSPNETLVLKRCLQPMNLNARVSASLGDVVTFSWDVTKDADSYALTIYSDGDVYLTEPVAPLGRPLPEETGCRQNLHFLRAGYFRKQGGLQGGRIRQDLQDLRRQG